MYICVMDTENIKIKVKKVIFRDSKQEPFTWKDLKHIDFDDDDKIRVEYVEPYYSENNSYEGHFIVEVERMVLETDEECEERIKEAEALRQELKARRYQSYLRLKKEFEV